MPPTSQSLPPTPYAFCRRSKARAGDTVLMLDANQVMTEFTIVRIDDESKTVRWALEGVWVDREWREMDRDAGYEVQKATKAKKGSVKA